MKQDFKEVIVTLNEICKEILQELPKHTMNQNNTIKEWINKTETTRNIIHIAENRIALYISLCNKSKRERFIG